MPISVDAVKRWLQEPNPWNRDLVYHTGYLPRDRQRDPELDAVAHTLVLAGEITWVKQSKCSHPRYTEGGEGRVRLIQQKCHDGESWVYIARRLN